MKKIAFSVTILSFVLGTTGLKAQNTAGKVTAGQFTLRNSANYESPKGHAINPALSYGNELLEINTDGVDSWNFQWFNSDLKLVKENTVEVKSKFGERVSLLEFMKTKTKTFGLFREVFRDIDAEGVTAIEIAPKEMNVKGASRNLFKSSGSVRPGSTIGYIGPNAWAFGAPISSYDYSLSEDSTKVVFAYALRPKERNDKLNKDVIGMYVFDDGLNKLWGSEVEMPYTEAKMDNEGYLITNNGEVCVLAKVYEGETKRDGARDKTKQNYHFEILIYGKNAKTPKIVEVRLDNYFNKSVYVYQDSKNNISIAGFYGKKGGTGIDGAYQLKLDIEKGAVAKVEGGYYELPTDFIKSFMSARELKKVEKKEENDEDFDLELNNLKIREVYEMPDGSTKIVSEIYFVTQTTTYSNGRSNTTYYYNYRDAVILSLKAGKLEWCRKIRKYQVSANAPSPALGFNTLVINNDLYIFWKDHPKNSEKKDDERLAKFGGVNGMLRGCSIKSNGDAKIQDIVDVGQYDMHFMIRNFVNGAKNNLVGIERRKKENVMFSIDVKP